MILPEDEKKIVYMGQSSLKHTLMGERLVTPCVALSYSGGKGPRVDGHGISLYYPEKNLLISATGDSKEKLPLVKSWRAMRFLEEVPLIIRDYESMIRAWISAGVITKGSDITEMMLLAEQFRDRTRFDVLRAQLLNSGPGDELFSQVLSKAQQNDDIAIVIDLKELEGEVRAGRLNINPDLLAALRICSVDAIENRGREREAWLREREDMNRQALATSQSQRSRWHFHLPWRSNTV